MSTSFVKQTSPLTVTPVTVTVFWSINGSPYTENPGYSDILLTVTLFCHPNTVNVSGEACNYNLGQVFVPPALCLFRRSALVERNVQPLTAALSHLNLYSPVCLGRWNWL